MSLWWLQPGWTSATCACGSNIWRSGGDPDWGECYDCFSARHTAREPEPPNPMCEICERHQSAAIVAGFYVCSQECADTAEDRAEVPTQEPAPDA